MKKGQVIVEYALILSIVLAAILAMQTYMKRGIQAVIKVSADELGNQQDAEEFDIKKGLLLVSGQRAHSSPGQLMHYSPGTEDYTQKQNIFLGGAQRQDINEKTEVLAFDNDVKSELPSDSWEPDFFAEDKRSGTLYYQGFQEEFAPAPE